MTQLLNKFRKLKDAFEANGLKVNLSGVITKDFIYKCKVHPCGINSLRVKGRSVCVGSVVSASMISVLEREKLIYRFQDIFLAENVKEILSTVEQEDKLCDEMEAARDFTYLGDRMSAGGGCEVAVTART